MDRKLTIGDIAEELGVSKTTISRAISGKGRIGLETREKILQYIDEHNYKPNVIAKGLATSKTYNIGLALPSDYNLTDLPFFQNCMMGVCETASSMNYDVIISVVSATDISQLERMINNNKVDGIILTRTLMNDPPAEYLKLHKVPFVTIGTTVDKDITQIDNDHRGACRELTGILLSRKVGKIGLIGGNRSYVVTQKRLQGYLDAYEDYHIPVDNNMIFLDVDNNIMTEKIVEEMLEQHVDCILCMDDSLCKYVLNKLKKQKVNVPQDVKVASFYNSNMLENNIPAITSLQFNVKDLGVISCNLLLDKINEKQVPQRTLLGYEVSMKESTKLIHK